MRTDPLWYLPETVERTVFFLALDYWDVSVGTHPNSVDMQSLIQEMYYLFDKEEHPSITESYPHEENPRPFPLLRVWIVTFSKRRCIVHQYDALDQRESQWFRGRERGRDVLYIVYPYADYHL